MGVKEKPYDNKTKASAAASLNEKRKENENLKCGKMVFAVSIKWIQVFLFF